MDDEADLSTDSFVDVFANTVGIIIIITILPIMLTKQQAQKGTMADIKSFGDKEIKGRKDLRKLLQEIGGEEAASQLPDDVEVLKRDRASQKIKLDELEGRVIDLSADIRALTIVKEDTEVRKIAKVKSLADIEDDLKKLAEKIEREFGKIPPDVRKQLEPESLDELKKQLAELEAERDKLKKVVAGLDAERQRLDDAIKQKQAEFEKQDREFRKMYRKSFVTDESQAPLARRAGIAVWVECYLPEGAPKDNPSLQRVRLINEKNYKVEGGQLVPLAKGETLPRILDADSTFQKFLKTMKVQFKQSHYLYFVVRPDAYTSFRAARKLAWDAGWRVEWDPAETGNTILIGKP